MCIRDRLDIYTYVACALMLMGSCKNCGIIILYTKITTAHSLKNCQSLLLKCNENKKELQYEMSISHSAIKCNAF